MKTELTRLEIEVLLDRLELDCGGCVAEALTDYCSGGEPFVPDNSIEVLERVARIVQALRITKCWPDALNHLDRAILVDCVDGSTFQCSRENPSEKARAIKVLASLAKKMIAAGIADRIYVPSA